MDKKKILKKLEEAITHPEKVSDVKFEELEHEIQEKPEEVSEGLGIEEKEEAGEEPYIEIEEAEKDPDEPEDEE